jgi:glycosyltransferase involved in cell wall biosynthesis
LGEDPEEWEHKTSNLLEDSLLREKMGREARIRVLEKYTVQSCAPRLFSILNRVLQKMDAIIGIYE